MQRPRPNIDVMSLSEKFRAAAEDIIYAATGRHVNSQHYTGHIEGGIKAMVRPRWFFNQHRGMSLIQDVLRHGYDSHGITNQHIKKIVGRYFDLKK